MTLNALDTALVELAAASTALERSNAPGIKDVEEAKEKAKKAHKILEAAHALLGYGVYTVASEPASGTPLFTVAGDPTPEAEVVAKASLPDLLDGFQDLGTEARFERFDRISTEVAETDTTPDDEFDGDWWDKWKTAYDADPVQTYAKAVFALKHREPIRVALPTDEEMAAWAAQFEAPASEPSQAETFDAKLRELEEAGIADGQKLKGWKKAEKAWRTEFEANPDAALAKIEWRLQQVSINWDVPADEEVVA